MRTLPAGAPRAMRRAALRALAATTLALLCGAVPSLAAAAGWPDKPVRLIVPNPAGGASDVLARLLGKELGTLWGQPVVVENKPGANGNIGATLVARSEADGHTLLLMDLSSLAISPALYPKLGYDPEKDLSPVSFVAYSPHILVVRNDLPVSNVKELAAYAKAHPNKLNYGETTGAITHLAGIDLARRMGYSWNYIGYKGGAQVLSDLTGGQIDATMNSFLATYPLVKAGKIKLLAVGSAQRFGLIPDTPTVGETTAGFESGSWQGLMTTGGTPPDVVAQINRDVNAVLSRPELRKQLSDLGSEPVSRTPAELAQWMRDQTQRWGTVVKDAGVSLQ
ncbi:Bug family tripartite tricarboxylate transporter substrate binding protein [Bordetella genomosp. 13]|uniref:Bug family tripartite tricarboxylate transporter substrate binding protein n=1 Tax=Bordetella genomosp. 13 TaxID=463040 RepID=UPI0011A7F476|nr:tripartite tricarboxylate transporter substrate binding protein [Bordetella genomosp. 13]